MQQYLDLLDEVLTHGDVKEDRTGIGTVSLFGRQIRFNLQEGFPLLTTKQVHFRSIVYELLWFIRGDTNISYLNDNDVHIWDEWANDTGNLGPVYGHQWRKFGSDWYTGMRGVDQLANVISQIEENPDSRRLVVSSWNPKEIPSCALPPCHCLFQFYVNDGKLSCQMYQRSADIFLGVPFNIASYALLTRMIAQVTGLIPYEFVHTFGDLHLYNNHREQASTQLLRSPRRLPLVVINPEIENINDFKFEDFELTGYDPHPRIQAPVAV